MNENENDVRLRLEPWWESPTTTQPSPLPVEWADSPDPGYEIFILIIMMMIIIIIIIMMIIIMILMMTTMMMLMTNTMMRTFALCLQRSGPIMINPKKIMTSMIIMMLDHHDDGNGFCRCWFY